MAAQLATQNAPAANSQPAALLSDFVKAFDSVQKQLSDGIVSPVVPYNVLSVLGLEGLKLVQKHLVTSARAQFECKIDTSSNSICFMPVKPLPAKSKSTEKDKDKDKIPRPPNAFIIYRKDWHPRILAQNPGLHNNAISVIIGDQWRNESEEVRTTYKRLAGDAKRQHEIDHPDYHYQPRRPSEKKRRMTKNKLAKLAAAEAQAADGTISAVQQPLPDDFDPLVLLNQSLSTQAADHPMQLTGYAHDPALVPQNLRNTASKHAVSFMSGPDVKERLRASLEEFNSQLRTQAPTQLPVSNSALVAQPMINDRFANDVGQFSMNVSLDDLLAEADWTKELQQLDDEATDDVLGHDPAAEIMRQNGLETAFDAFIDPSAVLNGTATL